MRRRRRLPNFATSLARICSTRAGRPRHVSPRARRAARRRRSWKPSRTPRPSRAADSPRWASDELVRTARKQNSRFVLFGACHAARRADLQTRRRSLRREFSAPPATASGRRSRGTGGFSPRADGRRRDGSADETARSTPRNEQTQVVSVVSCAAPLGRLCSRRAAPSRTGFAHPTSPLPRRARGSEAQRPCRAFSCHSAPTPASFGIWARRSTWVLWERASALGTSPPGLRAAQQQPAGDRTPRPRSAERPSARPPLG